jgi:type VI secretion system secreted protein Hcp
MAIYMKLQGINGSVTTKGYENWVAVREVEFGGVGFKMRNTPGNKNTRIQSPATFGDFTLIKTPDASSVPLFEKANTAQLIAQVEIQYLTSESTPMVYTKYVLTNVLVSHYSEMNGGGRSANLERLRLNYETIQKTYIPILANNTPGSQLVSG